MFGLFRRRRGNGCCCNGCCNACRSMDVVCYCSRYIDVPMQIYYGPGYTEIDCCVDTRDTLREIRDTLRTQNQILRCC